ncbi:urease accessory protein [Tistlia consotensis]|uniref:Urease accessory protein n=1 Tax=Tistlia consotensis USBA 355 TaxID=560819 RepID=A0A1Y6BWP5_9PROT|nr:HupE/UreJ family protein [Tistlia consotensis]SMF29061.1 urease accessory protein [Tistlia consotensis USBA 355]SNR91654.1 urease accessory protein [Tistlia consotensis]
MPRKHPMIALAAAAALLPAVAEAHVGVGPTSGFLHGFWHPLSGLDHVLAMVMVGVFAWQLGGRALWLVPATFVAVMAAGGALGAAGIGLPFVEVGIALSVVVLGAVVALGVQAPLAVATGLVGLFAIFHGHAHGAEMPESAGGLAYGGGFLAATALLHLAGLGLGVLVGRTSERYGPLVARSAGGLAALAGLGLLAAAL